MRRALATAAAVLTAAGLALVVAWPAEEPQTSDVLGQTQLVADILEREGAIPPLGMCWDVEVDLAVDGDGGQRAQAVYAVCGLDAPPFAIRADGGLEARTRAENRCTQAARDLCLPDASEPEPAERRCYRDAREECLAALQRSGGVVWHGPARPAPEDGGRALDRLSRREQMAQSCACRAKGTDAGMCRWWAWPGIDGTGPDAARPAPYDLVIQPGRWQGAGCVAAPCVEGPAREACGGPGCLMPEECR